MGFTLMVERARSHDTIANLVAATLAPYVKEEDKDSLPTSHHEADLLDALSAEEDEEEDEDDDTLIEDGVISWQEFSERMMQKALEASPDDGDMADG